jgi:uncharacterized Zn finger protein (UPF0148 family)
MLAITCDKCRRRFTATTEEIQGSLDLVQGKKHALVICPHCGKGNKVSLERMRQALRGVRPVTEEAPAEAVAAAGESEDVAEAASEG